MAACDEIDQSHEDTIVDNDQLDITYSFENPNTGQEFSIIHAYLLYENYFDAIEEHPDESLYKLFQQEIIEPIYEACIQDSKFIDSVTLLNWVPRNSAIENLKSQIGLINKDHLNELFAESLVKSSDILPSDEKTTVCVFPKEKGLPSDMFTVETGNIFVFHSRPDNKYKTSMSHEYHHSIWMRKHYDKIISESGLDRLIVEGGAMMFETLVYPELNHAQYYVDESFNTEYWSKVEPYLEDLATTEFVHEIVEGGTNGFPQNYGYSEGYKMIRSYLKLHPNMTVEEWTSKSSKEIFEEGNYISNYR